MDTQPNNSVVQTAGAVNTVRLVPDMCAAALKLRETNSLALYFALKSLNAWGSGVLDIDMAIEGLQSVFSYSRRTVFRHLAVGEGEYWIRSGSRLHIQSYKAVAAHLGIEVLTDKHFRECPSDKFDTLMHRRKAIYAAIHRPAGIKGSPRSRVSIEAGTGLARVQQRRYETAPGGVKIKRVPTYAVKRRYPSLVFEPVRVTVYSKHRAYEVNKRLPNVYYSDLEAGSRGQLKHLVKLVGKSKRSFEVAGALSQLTKRYYQVFKALRRAFQRVSQPFEGYVMVQSNKRIIRGRLEYEKVVLLP